MESWKTSNVYYPDSRTWMTWGLEDNPDPQSDSDSDSNMETDDEYVVPIGLISTAIENPNYCKMLEVLEIDHPTANEWIDQIKTTMQSSFPEFLRCWRQPVDLEQEVSRNLERNSSIVAAFIWSKKPISKICAEVGVKRRLVKEVIHKFILKLKHISRERNRSPSRRKKMTPEKVEYMRKFVEKNSGRIITLQQAWKATVFKYSEIKSLSKSTMSNVFKNELKLTYKKVATKDSKTNLLSNKQKLYSSTIAIWRLLERGINIVFIDEYSIKSRNLKPYNWAKRGEKAFLDKSQDSFKASIIIAVSRERIIWMQATTGNWSGVMFKEFIKAVILRLKEINGMNSAKPLLVCDNSLIHTAGIVKNYLESNKVSMMTLTPYNPWSNPAEFAIQWHKQKLKKIIFDDK